MKKQNIGLVLAAPGISLLFFIYAYPILYNFWLSFYRWDLITMAQPVYVGLQNYQNMINYWMFQLALKNTVIFACGSVALEFLIGLLLAFALSKINKGRRVYTTLFIISLAMPDIVTSVGWKFILSPGYGAVNAIIGREILWLADSRLALLSVILADTWKIIPWFTIIFLAAIISIPPSLYEALKIDGGGTWQEFRNLVLPQIYGVIIIAITMRIIDAFTKVFNVVYMVTGGGPGGASYVLPLMIFTSALGSFRWGEAASLGVLALAFSILLTAAYIRMVLKR